MLVGLTGIMWFAFRWLQLKPLPETSRQTQPDIALSQSELTRYGEQGQRLWTVYAKTIELDDKTRSTVVEGVEVLFWSETTEGVDKQSNENVTLTVKAERLTLDNFRKDLSFSGKLEATDDQGLRFVTQGARWSNKSQVLEGDMDVKVERDDLLFEGVGFRYDARSGKFLIKENAHLRWVLSQERR